MLKKLKNTVGDLAAKAGDLKGLGVEAVQATVTEFNAIRPLFARVGYRVTKVQLEIGLTPKLMFQLRHVAETDDAEFDALLAEHQGNRVLSTIVAALRQAAVLQAKVKFQGMRFAEVEVELGIPPAIKLTFKEEAARGSSGEITIPASIAAPAAPQAAPPAPAAPAPPAPNSEERDRLKKEDQETLIAAGVAMRFPCQGCGKLLITRVKYAGREGECRHCHGVYLIPGPPEVASGPPAAVEGPAR